MEMTIAKQFTILSLHPEKGRKIIPNPNFRYALTGACLMDFYLKGEVSFQDNRVIFSARRNTDLLHDRLLEKIETASGPRKISYWIRRLSWRGRQNFRDSIAPLTEGGMVRHEKLYFLGFIPYNRYFITDPRVRQTIIERLRDVVISGRSPDNEQLMILSLLKVSRSLRHLAYEPGERSVIRARCRELFRKDENKPDSEKYIRAVMSAVGNAIAASEASHAS